MSHLIKPFQLLEINIISGQDLELVSKNMRTYATAWVHPKRKLSTSVDSQGGNNPTWNDKFVFRVDEEFLRLDTSAVMIEIYASHWFRDTLVGSVRVLVGNLIPPPTHPRHHHHHHHSGMRFAALHVRRPSGRPQGILNIGVAVLDSSMRSMPLYTQLSTSAVGFHDLMGEEGPNHHNHPNNYPNSNLLPPILRRSRSERSDRLTFDDLSTTSGSIVGAGQKKGLPGKASSMLSGSEYSTVAPKGKNKKGKAGSMLSGSEYSTTAPRGKSNKGKASSVISAAEFREKPIENGKKVKASSVINGSIVSKDSHKEKTISNPPNEKLNDPTSNNDKQAGEKSPAKSYMSGVVIGLPTKEGSASATAIGKPPISKLTSYEFGGPKGSSIVNGKYIHGPPPPPPPHPQKAHSIWTDSEVGPSPSEVATAMMMARERERYTYTVDDNQSSVLDGWSIDESVEGLRSKLERWRTELPPLYDRGGGGGFAGSSSYRSTSQHVRRHTDGGGGSGLFSCFGNIYGYECQIICGKPPDGRRSLSGRFQSPSASAGRSFH